MAGHDAAQRQAAAEEYEQITSGVTLRAIRDLSDAEVVRRHDWLVAQRGAVWQLTPDDYRE